MGLQMWVLGVLLMAVTVLGFLAFVSGERPVPDPVEAREVALHWTDAARADKPRRVESGWEVDVRREDGSLVEVSLDRSLGLQELDEELGPDGMPAHDAVTDEARDRAIGAARPRSGGGWVRSVEREEDGTVEVDFVTPERTVIEVELDQRLRVKDVDEEEVGDE